LRVLLRRASADRELSDEIEHFQQELRATHVAQGLPPAEAARRARHFVGTELALREEVRGAAWESRFTSLLDDIRYAARRLGRSPGFTIAATLTLALGIGASAALFTVIDAVLLKPLPFPHADRVVSLMHSAPGINLRALRMSPSFYFTYREESRVFEDVALWVGNRSTVTGLGDPEQERTIFATPSFLEVLGVRVALGRGLAAADADPNGERVVILSDRYWRDKFSASRDALGRPIHLNGNPHTVVGVLPSGFDFLDERAALLVPYRLNRSEVELISFSEDGIARVKPGVTLAEVRRDMARCIPLAQEKFPMNRGLAKSAFRDARVTPAALWLKDHQIGNIGDTLWILWGAVGILLLIACANIANLLLVRAESRQRECAVRQALGAGWGRLAQDLLTESVLLGLAGGVAAIFVCYAGVLWVQTTALTSLPRLNEVEMNLQAVIFTLALAGLCGLLFGLVPVWRQRRLNPSAAHTGRHVSLSRERGLAQKTLLFTQVALATLLVIASGLLLRSYRELSSVDTGLREPEQVQIVRVSFPASLMESREQVYATQRAILESFSKVSGVGTVSITTAAPLEGTGQNPVYVEGQEDGAGKLPPVRRNRDVSPGFARSAGGRIVAGRDFSWSDMQNSAPVAMISENWAREQWGSAQGALGRRIRSISGGAWREIVGVMSDFRDEGVTRPAPTMVFWPLVSKDAEGRLSVQRHVDFMIRTPRAASVAFVQELRTALRSVNASLPLANVRTLGDAYRRSMARPAFALLLMGLAGGMALLLGVVGIYGVMAYAVERRRKEIGIRVALGAEPLAVALSFLKQGFTLTAIGAAFGLLAAFGAIRWMSALLFGVSPFDAATYLSAIAILALAAGVATWLPARRASHTDPIQALRAE
jgi:predicted permease